MFRVWWGDLWNYLWVVRSPECGLWTKHFQSPPLHCLVYQTSDLSSLGFLVLLRNYPEGSLAAVNMAFHSLVFKQPHTQQLGSLPTGKPFLSISIGSFKQLFLFPPTPFYFQGTSPLHPACKITIPVSGTGLRPGFGAFEDDHRWTRGTYKPCVKK